MKKMTIFILALIVTTLLIIALQTRGVLATEPYPTGYPTGYPSSSPYAYPPPPLPTSTPTPTTYPIPPSPCPIVTAYPAIAECALPAPGWTKVQNIASPMESRLPYLAAPCEQALFRETVIKPVSQCAANAASKQNALAYLHLEISRSWSNATKVLIQVAIDTVNKLP